MLSLQVSAIRLCTRRNDYQSRIVTTVYIIFTTAISIQLKAENCCAFKCVFVRVGKTRTESSFFV